MADEVSGSTAFLGLPEMIQFLGFNHRTLVLALAQQEVGSGGLLFRDGRIINAALDDIRGEEALNALVKATGGRFRIVPAGDSMEEAMSPKLDDVLMRIVMGGGGAPVETDPDWTVEGTTALLGVPEILQIFEANRRTCRIELDAPSGPHVMVCMNGLLARAESPKRTGADAVYAALALDDVPFRIVVPNDEQAPTTFLPVNGLVMEGLRRRDEAQLLGSELNADRNEHAREMLDALAAGELSTPERMALARRYLPDGQVAPASVLAPLSIDPEPEVREAALRSLGSLPEPVLTALANDEETPPPLLAYLMRISKSGDLQTALLRNPSLPVAAVAEKAAEFKMDVLEFLNDDKRWFEYAMVRSALRQNPKCFFLRKLDELDTEKSGVMRKVSFDGFGDDAPAGPDERPEPDLVLEEPELDPDVEEVESSPTYADLLLLAMKGSAKERAEITQMPDDTLAVTAISTPGLPDTAIELIAANTSANPNALKWIGENARLKKVRPVMMALLFNPKTPVSVTRDFVTTQSNDIIRKVADDRDLPTPLREAAQNRLNKKH